MGEMWISTEDQIRLNSMHFRGCDNILMGDVLHYSNVDTSYGFFKKMILILKLIKKTFLLPRVEVYSRGELRTICLYAIGANYRDDHEKAFDNVVGLLDDYAAIKFQSLHISLKYIKYIKFLYFWNKEMKKGIVEFGKRIHILNHMYEVFLRYKYIKNKFPNLFEKAEYLLSFCDVHPMDCFLVQKFNFEQRTTVTLQHGAFSLVIDPWAYSGSKSKYMLMDSPHSVDSAKSVGYKNNAIPVGSMHCINNKIIEKPTQFKTDVIGVIMNSNMTPKEDNIGMINIVQEFCKKYKKRILIKYHPNNNPEDYKSIIDSSVVEECKRTTTIEEFLNKVDVIVVCDSTVFTTSLFNWIPTILFYRDGFDVNKYLNSDEVKFSSLVQMENLITRISDDRSFFCLMERYREYYLSKGDIKENYRKAFKEIGMSNE